MKTLGVLLLGLMLAPILGVFIVLFYVFELVIKVALWPFKVIADVVFTILGGGSK